MGNEHCCDDKDKGGQFNKSTEKVSGRVLNKYSTSDVERSFYNQYPKTRNSLPSNIEASSPKQEEGISKNISSNLIKVLKGEQSLSQDREQQQHGLLNRSKKPSFEHMERQPFQKHQENDSGERMDKILNLIPDLIPEVKKIYQQQNFFNEVEVKDIVIRQYENQIYEGQIQNNMPNGFGKFYKQDNSFFIGYFKNGKAHGKGAYIFNDGSYFNGEFVDNMAECEDGQYYGKDLTYVGSFKGNLFHGRGQQEGPTHTFKGDYAHGYKAQGLLTWSQGMDRYKYEGTFNEKGIFHGQGRLEQPTGCYQGDFEEGFKHGIGTYKFINLIQYHGDYNYNVRQGHGKLSNPGGKLAYQGQFKDGLPHGQGFIPGKNGTKQPSTWIMGIDSSVL